VGSNSQYLGGIWVIRVIRVVGVVGLWVVGLWGY
jgi:hypothetical protein